MNLFKRGIGLILLGLLTACSPAGSVVSPLPPASGTPSPLASPTVVPPTVTLYLFSGRPDPVWTLTAEQTATFTERLAALPAGTPQAEPEGLGYRGLALQLADQTIRLFNAAVRVEQNGQVRWLADPHQALALWLLATGEPAIGQDLVAMIQRELEAEPPALAFYLLARAGPAAEVASTPPALLPRAAQPFLTLNDVLTYTQATHTLTLTPEAWQHLAMLEVPVNGLPFVLYVRGEPIYAGALWTPLSSLSYDGVTMLWPSGLTETLRLDLGYPGPAFFTGDDPRADPRLLQVLTEAGKLH